LILNAKNQSTKYSIKTPSSKNPKSTTIQNPPSTIKNQKSESRVPKLRKGPGYPLQVLIPLR
jgi:hypothetical protein